jgi:hypothetical protein
MNKKVWIILGVLAGVGLLSCACCGIGSVFFVIPKIQQAADRTKRQNDLKSVALAILLFQDSKKRGPANVDELSTELAMAPLAIQRIRNREIEVVWNAARVTDQPNGGSQTVIAWESKAEAGGNRLVAYMDGQTAVLTEQEFQQKPKAVRK